MEKSSSPDNPVEMTGGCLCGALRYRISGEPLSVGNCHCSMCRRFHGTAFSTYLQLNEEQVYIDSGVSQLARIQSSSEVTRSFCGTCGSPFSYETTQAPGMVWITAGTLDGDPAIEPTYHIFVGSKASWYNITDDLTQFEGFPPEHG